MLANNVVLETVRADNSGNVFFVSREGIREDENVYAAYHFDRRIGDLNTIVSDVSFEDAVKSVGYYREGKRV